jgi:hypothetical protein
MAAVAVSAVPVSATFGERSGATQQYQTHDRRRFQQVQATHDPLPFFCLLAAQGNKHGPMGVECDFQKGFWEIRKT